MKSCVPCEHGYGWSDLSPATEWQEAGTSSARGTWWWRDGAKKWTWPGCLCRRHFMFAAAAVAQRIKELSNRTCGGIGTLETPSTAAAASSLRASDAQFHVMWTRPGQLVRAIPSGYARSQAGIARPCATLPFPVIIVNTFIYYVHAHGKSAVSNGIPCRETFRLHLGFACIV